MKFTDFKLSAEIVQGLSDAGYSEATPLQEQVLPPALGGSNLLVRARSGQGKDGAFIIPTLANLAEARKNGHQGVGALILTASPPRVAKIDELLWVSGYHAHISSAQLVFKGDRDVQEQALKDGVPVLISNPRYFSELCKAGRVDLSKLQVLIFDELDTLLNEGDAKHLYSIIESIPPHPYQVMAFAERTARSMEKVMGKSCDNTLLTIGFDRFSPNELETESVGVCSDQSGPSQPSRHQAPPPVQTAEAPHPHHDSKHRVADRPAMEVKPIPKQAKQAYIRVPSRMKITTLTSLVEEKAVGRMVVFTASKRGSDRLFRVFKSQQREVVRVNGRQSAEERQEMMDRFNRKEADLILISEINASEIQLSQVDYLINYDVPDTFADYSLRVHGVQGNSTMHVVSLVSENDTDDISRLQDKTAAPLPEWPLPERAQKKYEEKKARAAKGDERPAKKKPRAKRPPRNNPRGRTNANEQKQKNHNRPPKRRKRTEAAKLTELPKADFGALDKSRDKKAAKESKGVVGFFKRLFS